MSAPWFTKEALAEVRKKIDAERLLGRRKSIGWPVQHHAYPAADQNCPSCPGVLHTEFSTPPTTRHYGGDADCERNTQ